MTGGSASTSRGLGIACIRAFIQLMAIGCVIHLV